MCSWSSFFGLLYMDDTHFHFPNNHMGRRRSANWIGDPNVSALIKSSEENIKKRRRRRRSTNETVWKRSKKEKRCVCVDLSFVRRNETLILLARSDITFISFLFLSLFPSFFLFFFSRQIKKKTKKSKVFSSFRFCLFFFF